MRKGILYALGAAVIAAAIISVFAFRLKFLEDPAGIALHRAIGMPVHFDKIHYRLLNRITIENLTIGSSIQCSAVTAYINPWALLTAKNRLASVRSISLDQPAITTGPDLDTLIKKLSPSPSAAPAPNMAIAWKHGMIRSGTLVISDITGHIETGAKTTAQSTLIVANRKCTASLYRDPSQLIKAIVELSGDDEYAKALFSLRTASGTVAGSYVIPAISIKSRHLANAHGTFALHNGAFKTSLTHPDITAELNYSSAAITAQGRLSLSLLVSSATGNAGFSLTKNGDAIGGRLSAENIRWNNLLVTSSATARFNNNPLTHAWYGEAFADPARYIIKFFSSGDGTFKAVCKAHSGESGTIAGIFSSTGTNVSIDFPDWPLARLPLIAAVHPEITGTALLQGTVSRDLTQLTITVPRMVLDEMRPLAWSGEYVKTSSETMITAGSSDAAWHCVAQRSSDSWNVQASFDNMPVGEYARLAAYALPFDGFLSGSASYSTRARSGECALTLKDFQYDRVSIPEMKLRAAIDGNAVDLKEYALFSKEGTLTATGSIGLTGASPETRVTILSRQFSLASHRFSGTFTLKGSLDPAGEVFTGDLSGEEIAFNALASMKLLSQFTCSGKQLAVSSLKLLPYVKGAGTICFDRPGTISAKATISKLPVNHIIPALNGTANAEVSVNGTRDEPFTAIRIIAPALTCKSVPFSANAQLHGRADRWFIDTATIKSGKGNVQCSGLLTPDLKVNGTIHEIDLHAVEQLIGGFPLPVKGTVSAGFSSRGSLNNPLLDLSFSGSNIIYDKLKATHVAGTAKYHDRIMTIASVSVKIADSEFLVVGSTVNFAASSFDINTIARNTHIALFDLFGSIHITGSWLTPDALSKPLIRAVIDVSDAWINQCSLQSASIPVNYRDGLLTFTPAPASPLQIGGTVNLSALPQVSCNHLSISNPAEHRSLTAHGTAGPDQWNFSLLAHNASAGSIGEVFNLPTAIEGDLEAALTASGSLESPVIDSSMTIVNGSIAGIPCDRASVQFNVRDNTAKIINALWVKDKLYTVVAKGFMPFALDKASFKKVRSKPMDITLSVEEGSLGFLTALSKDIKAARGTLLSQLRLAGTLERPVTNGFIKIVNGELESRAYVHKATHINADCLWRNNLLTFRNFQGKIGSGSVTVKGSIKFNGFAPGSYDLSLKTDNGKGIPVSIPELPIPSPVIKTDLLSTLSRGEPQCAVTLTGLDTAPVLSGYVQLDNTNFTFPSLTPKSDSETIISLFIGRIHWNLDLRAGKNTWYENTLVHVNVQGGIHLGGVGRSPEVNGKMEAIRGTVMYLGTEFTLKNAALEISKNNVFVDGEAEAEVPNIQTGVPDIITVTVDHGPLEQLTPRFSSPNNPTMSSEKALAVVAGADPERMSNTDQQYYVRQQFIRLFDATLATPIAKNILRRSGIADTFHVSYQPKENLTAQKPGAPTLSELMVGTKYSMAKYLTDKMLVGYSLAFDQIQDKLDLRHELELSYRLMPNLYLKGLYELNSYDSFHPADRRLTVEKQLRFDLWPNTKKKQK